MGDNRCKQERKIEKGRRGSITEVRKQKSLRMIYEDIGDTIPSKHLNGRRSKKLVLQDKEEGEEKP